MINGHSKRFYQVKRIYLVTNHLFSSDFPEFASLLSRIFTIKLITFPFQMEAEIGQLTGIHCSLWFDQLRYNATDFIVVFNINYSVL